MSRKELINKMEQFTERVLQGSGNVTPQETAVLPQVLEMLLREKPSVESGRAEKGVREMKEITMPVSIENLDAAIEKAKQLVELLKEAQEIIDLPCAKESRDIEKLKKDIDKRVADECEAIKKAANPRRRVNEYIRNIRWMSPELAAYLKREMSKGLNLDD